MIFSWRHLPLLIALIFTLQTNAQPTLSSLEFFKSKEVIHCKLTSDFKFFRKEKNKSDYQPAQLTIYYASGDSATADVKIKARGNFRKAHCLFPPIMIKFKKEEYQSSLSTYNKLKIVTHCRSQPAYTTRLYEEYLIYEMYRLFTPYSMKVRMLNISYVDTGSKKDPGVYPAFLIQDIEEVAALNDAVEIKTKNIHMERLNRYYGTLLPMFEYMIGNTDWSVPGRHNVKLLKENDPTKYEPIPVPYDFDYSGLLDAPYAVPQEFLGTESVTTRVYRGYCRTEEEFSSVIKEFIDQKRNILALIDDNPWLDKREIQNDRRYLDEFFQQLESGKFIQRTLLPSCRQPGVN